MMTIRRTLFRMTLNDAREQRRNIRPSLLLPGCTSDGEFYCRRVDFRRLRSTEIANEWKRRSPSSIDAYLVLRAKQSFTLCSQIRHDLLSDLFSFMGYLSRVSQGVVCSRQRCMATHEQVTLLMPEPLKRASRTSGSTAWHSHRLQGRIPSSHAPCTGILLAFSCKTRVTLCDGEENLLDVDEQRLCVAGIPDHSWDRAVRDHAPKWKPLCRQSFSHPKKSLTRLVASVMDSSNRCFELRFRAERKSFR